jgi:hypothetical protein
MGVEPHLRARLLGIFRRCDVGGFSGSFAERFACLGVLRPLLLHLILGGIEILLPCARGAGSGGPATCCSSARIRGSFFFGIDTPGGGGGIANYWT